MCCAISLRVSHLLYTQSNWSLPPFVPSVQKKGPVAVYERPSGNDYTKSHVSPTLLISYFIHIRLHHIVSPLNKYEQGMETWRGKLEADKAVQLRYMWSPWSLCWRAQRHHNISTQASALSCWAKWFPPIFFCTPKKTAVKGGPIRLW